MIYFLALIPATGLTVMGYFVFYLASRSDGSFQRFGKYLGFWAFTLAGLVILGAIFAAANGHHQMHGRMHGPWHGPGPRFFGPRGDEFQPGAPPETTPAAPTPPASH